MWRLRPPAILAVLTLLLVGSSAAAPSLGDHEAYIWQRRWTPELGDAMGHSADLVAGWRVLAAEIDAAGRVHRAGIDWTRLEVSGRPVTLVLRIDGQLAGLDRTALRGVLRTVVSEAARRPGVAGLELDHDCATRGLSAYAELLLALRPEMPERLRLSITALPAWLASPKLEAVARAVDEVVLQVHAVESPRAALLDPERAFAWVEAFARRTERPFRVALPSYGARVAWRDDGRATVESEAPLLAGGSAPIELGVDPHTVLRLVDRLRARRLPGLEGFVWFRLPTEVDRRAWSLATWRGVLQGRLPPPSVMAVREDGGRPGLSHVVLVNDGDADAPLPREIALPPTCALADGANGYALEREGARQVLRRMAGGTLRSRHRRVAGWIRCGSETGALDVRA